MEQKWESRSKPFNFEWVNFNKSAETIQGGKNTPIFSTNSVEITGCPHAKDWNWAPSSHHTWKLTQMNHRRKCESTSIKLLEKKMGVNLCKFTSLIIHKIKSTSDKIKMHKSHCIKIKSAFFFFAANDTSRKWKHNPFPNHILDKPLISGTEWKLL